MTWVTGTASGARDHPPKSFDPQDTALAFVSRHWSTYSHGVVRLLEAFAYPIEACQVSSVTALRGALLALSATGSKAACHTSDGFRTTQLRYGSGWGFGIFGANGLTSGIHMRQGALIHRKFSLGKVNRGTFGLGIPFFTVGSSETVPVLKHSSPEEVSQLELETLRGHIHDDKGTANGISGSFTRENIAILNLRSAEDPALLFPYWVAALRLHRGDSCTKSSGF